MGHKSVPFGEEYPPPQGFCMAGDCHVDQEQEGSPKDITRVVLNAGSQEQFMRFPLPGYTAYDFRMEAGSFLAGQDPSFQQDYHALLTQGGLRVVASYRSAE